MWIGSSCEMTSQMKENCTFWEGPRTVGSKRTQILRVGTHTRSPDHATKPTWEVSSENETAPAARTSEVTAEIVGAAQPTRIGTASNQNKWPPEQGRKELERNSTLQKIAHSTEQKTDKDDLSRACLEMKRRLPPQTSLALMKVKGRRRRQHGKTTKCDRWINWEVFTTAW